MTIDECRQQLQLASPLHLKGGPPSSEERHLVQISLRSGRVASKCTAEHHMVGTHQERIDRHCNLEELQPSAAHRSYCSRSSRRMLDGLGVEDVKQVRDCHPRECGFDCSSEAGSKSKATHESSGNPSPDA